MKRWLRLSVALITASAALAGADFREKKDAGRAGRGAYGTLFEQGGEGLMLAWFEVAAVRDGASGIVRRWGVGVTRQFGIPRKLPQKN